MTFAVKILGAGSATPLKGRHHSSQLLTVSEHKYLIDCGEGTQYRLVEEKLSVNKIEAIFISHLHGDHFYGLVGLISTMSLLGRQSPVHVFAPPGLNDVFVLNFRLSGTVLSFDLHVHEINTEEQVKIFEDNAVTVFCFPLKHGVKTHGFIFEEKPRPLNLIRDNIPKEMVPREMVLLKSGADVYDDAGNIKYAFKDYTLPPLPLRKYAYCSDTVYYEPVADYVKGVDLLYHEATFLEDLKEKAIKNHHSTAVQAATIAKMANVRKLLIGHMSSRYEDYEEHLFEARAVFEQTFPAVEGKSFSL